MTSLRLLCLLLNCSFSQPPPPPPRSSSLPLVCVYGWFSVWFYPLLLISRRIFLVNSCILLVFGFLNSFLVPPVSFLCTRGTLVLQVANQSAVSQEQVDNILQENDALRTNLAALEQVTDQENIISMGHL